QPPTVGSNPTATAEGEAPGPERRSGAFPLSTGPSAPRSRAAGGRSRRPGPSGPASSRSPAGTPAPTRSPRPAADPTPRRAAPAPRRPPATTVGRLLGVRVGGGLPAVGYGDVSGDSSAGCAGGGEAVRCVGVVSRFDGDGTAGTFVCSGCLGFALHETT